MKQLTRLSALLLACLVLLGSTLVACAAEQPSGFSDVSPDAWYADAVSWCRENGIMGGTSETAFSPNSPMTRAMLATVLHRAAGEPEAGRTTPFSDVSPDTWYTEAVAWAADQGLVTGYGNGRFGTDDPITREQLATILWRYAGSPDAAGGPAFKDAADLSGYARSAVSWAAAQGIVTGLDDSRFAPKDNATRAQVATILTRYLSQDTQPAPVPEPQKPEAAGYPAFDLAAGTVPLNDGHTMPILGIGTYALSDQQAENSVYWALKAGFRLIDTARIYGNEPGVGRGIRRAIDEGIVKREEIFVTTKMWTSDFDNGDAAIDSSLSRLGLDYIDLMILHHSQPSNDVQAYQAMERAVEAGKLRSIGLSNYYTPADFDRLVNATTIKPALLQNETHPYHQSGEMKDHIARYGTVLESWFPLGGRGNTQTLFNDPTISGIAQAHGVSSAQVIIRWHLQAGNICIPGSSNEQHIIEDFDVWDFALTDQEMAQMTALERDARFANY